MWNDYARSQITAYVRDKYEKARAHIVSASLAVINSSQIHFVETTVDVYKVEIIKDTSKLVRDVFHKA